MSFFGWFKQRIRGGHSGSGAPSGSEPISCEEALRVVQEFLDGELKEVPQEKVRAHFEACGRCYPHLRLEQAFRDAVRRGCGSAAAPTELRERLGELLREAGRDD